MPIDWPNDFHVLPDDSAIHRPSTRPCRCGKTIFSVVRTAMGTCSVQCPACCRPKPGDRVLGTLDVKTWKWTPAK